MFTSKKMEKTNDQYNEKPIICVLIEHNIPNIAILNM